MFDLASAHSYITLNHILLIAYKLLINFKRGGGLKSKSVTRNLLNQCSGALKSDWADIYLRLIYNNLPTAFVPTSQVCCCKSQIGIWHSCLWTLNTINRRRTAKGRREDLSNCRLFSTPSPDKLFEPENSSVWFEKTSLREVLSL